MPFSDNNFLTRNENAIIFVRKLSSQFKSLIIEFNFNNVKFDLINTK